MRLWLRPEQTAQLIAFARQAAPHECCGLLAGRGERVESILPIPNAATDPHHHFHMEDAAFVRAMFSLEAQGLELLSFYHSHPASPPIPSTTDIANAGYPDTAYLIIGLQPTSADLAAWSIRSGRVTPIDLHIGDFAPLPETAPNPQASRWSFILAAVLSCLMVLVIALSLLPPAPPIPGR